MLGRVVIPASPELTVDESIVDIQAALKELEDTDFCLVDWYVNPHNVNEIILFGHSDLFTEPYRLHHLIDNGYEKEMWQVREHNDHEEYEYRKPKKPS